MEKILVIEDEKSIRDIITDILEFEGYDYKYARDGKEGVITAKEYNPDLVICDIMMPEMTGYEVLQELKKEGQTENIPFIFLTALTDKRDIRKGMDFGADDYITKPFTNEELINSVKVRLRKSSGVKKKMDDLRDSIAYSLPHELRTPLVSILGYSELLMDLHNDISTQDIYEYSRIINSSGIRLNRLIQNYILYSKLEIYNKTEIIEEQEYDSIPNELMIQTVDKIARNYDRIEDVSTDFGNTLVKCNLENFVKILEELTDNAFKFSAKGTKVEIRGFDAGNRYTITFSDRGRGMTQEQISNIGAYQQFERKKFEQQGSGLGLIIAMILTKLCKGTITINSEYGKGTIIIVSIPT